MRKLGLVATCIGAALLVAGCGDDESSSEGQGQASSAVSSRSAGGLVQSSPQSVENLPASSAIQGQGTLLSVNGLSSAMRALKLSLNREFGGADKQSASVHGLSRLSEPALEAPDTGGGVQQSVGAGASLNALNQRVQAQRVASKQSAGLQSAAGLQGTVLQASPGVGGAAVGQGQAVAKLEQAVAARRAARRAGTQSSAAAGTSRVAGAAAVAGGAQGGAPGREPVTLTLDEGSAVSGAVSSQAISGQATASSVSAAAAMARLQRLVAQRSG